MTLLEELCTPAAKKSNMWLLVGLQIDEARRNAAIAQAVEEFKIDGYAQQIIRRADELLAAKERP